MKRDLFRFTALTTWGLAALAILASPAAAQVQLNTQAAMPPGEVPVEVRDGAIQLSLNEAVELALRRNLGLVIERYTRTQARLGVEQALGVYDPLASVDLQASDISRPPTSVTAPTDSNSQQLTLGLSQFLPTGGQLSVGWQTSRSETDLSGQFAFVNPQYNSGLNFSFTQPLLRDFGRGTFERQLLIAQNQNLGSNQEFARQVMATLQQVINAYWNLVEARAQLDVARQSLALAKELHERNRIQVEVGTMAPLELVQSEANIATNEEQIISSQTVVGNSEDELRRLLNLPQGPLWEAEIRPATEAEVQVPAIDVGAAIRTAIEARPEVRAQQLIVEQARINAAFFRNQTLPSLDLTLNYGLNGNNGVTIVNDAGTPQIVTGQFSDSLDQVFGIDFDGWSAQLTLGYPIGNRGARAASAIADLTLESAEAALAQSEQQITTEVRQAARQVDSAAKQIDAARASVRFQERSLDAEKKRYENGMSSSFEITRIQQDLTAARSREVTAVIAYRTALTQYQQATGQLLPTYSIVIDDPNAPVDRWSFGLFGRRNGR
ncbi:MAG TPA: TolC family protein [Thermoanaerobaculia bacterium]|nr:TolC family protein [Thermoanaerobaculia bacterium]